MIQSISRHAFLRTIRYNKLGYSFIVQYNVENNLLLLGRSVFHTVNRRFSNVIEKKFFLKGVYPPITTPFNEDETIAYDHLEANLEKWNKIPFNGYVILGSTGEFVSLTSEEMLKLVKVVVQKASPHKHIIVGCGCQSTKSTVEMAETVAKFGANAVLAITPSFYKTRLNEDSFYLHYSKVSKIGHVIFKTKNEEFKVLAGSAGFFFPALSIGCVGGVFALANPLGEPLCHLYQLYLEGKLKEACNLQYRLIAPNMAVTAHYGIAGVKHAMDVFGYYGGPARFPLQKLSKDDKRIVEKEFQANGFMADI